MKRTALFALTLLASPAAAEQPPTWLVIENPVIAILDRSAGTGDLIIDLSADTKRGVLLDVWVEDYGIPRDAVAIDVVMFAALTPGYVTIAPCEIGFYSKTESVPMPVGGTHNPYGNATVDRDGTTWRQLTNNGAALREYTARRLPVENGTVQMTWFGQGFVHPWGTRSPTYPCWGSMKVKIMGYVLGDVTKVPVIVGW